MQCVSLFLGLLFITHRSNAQSTAKSVLFTDPRLDPVRCTLLFNNLLNLPNFTQLKEQKISPLFLPFLLTPPLSGELANQFKIIQNKSILLEIGPDYFYGPSYFPKQVSTNVDKVDRMRLFAFDLNKDVQNEVLKSALNHVAQMSDIVKLAYVYDDTEVNIDPFTNSDDLGFIKNLVGQFFVHYLSSFDAPEDVLNPILVEGASTIVLNVPQDSALKILKRAEEKNILNQPFYWIVFNAGITLSGQGFNVDDTNFYAIEFSTNGKLQSFPELASLPRPITPQDLIFRDTAVKAFVMLQKSLNNQVSDPSYITCSFDAESNQTWILYSYAYTTQDAHSTNMIRVPPNLDVQASFQELKPAPSQESLLELMKKKGLRLGTIVVPPLITESNGTNGTTILQGPEIVLAQELMKRLGVPYKITVINEDVGTQQNDGTWNGVFGKLQKWDIDLLVGPFTIDYERSKSFQSTIPYQSFSYKFILHTPFLKPSLEIFQFAVAFDVYTWLMILLTAIVITATLTLLHKISPNTLNYSIHPSLIFVFGYLFQGVRTRPPSRASSQIVIVVWWFFSLIVVIAFCANYAAYRSFRALETLPDSLNTLLHQEYYKYAYIKGSNLEYVMSNPLNPSIYSLYVMINTKFANVIPQTREQGIDQAVLGGFALLDESPMADYNALKYCLTPSAPLFFGAYVFYMPKLLLYSSLINDELGLMKSDGTVDKILKEGQAEQYATLPKFCGLTFKDQALEAMRNPLVMLSPYSIEFAVAFGIFVICLGGVLLVSIALIVECCLGVYKKNTDDQHE